MTVASSVWPGYARIVADGLAAGRRSDVARSEADDGAVRQVRVRTEALDTRSVQILVGTGEQLEAFQGWAAGNAAAWFLFPDPVRGAQVEARVVDGAGGIRYEERAVAGSVTWSATCELEVRPGTSGIARLPVALAWGTRDLAWGQS